MYKGYEICVRCKHLLKREDFITESRCYSVCKKYCNHGDSYKYTNKELIKYSYENSLEYVGGYFNYMTYKVILSAMMDYFTKMKKIYRLEESVDKYNTFIDEGIDNLNTTKRNIDEDAKLKIRSKSDVCRYCGLDKVGSIDHIIPLSRGGNNDLSNLGITCSFCNSIKDSYTDKEMRDFYLKYKVLFDERIDLIKRIRLYEDNIIGIQKELKARNKEYLERGVYPDKKDKNIKRLKYLLDVYTSDRDKLSNLEELNGIIRFLADKHFNSLYGYI